MSEVAERSEQHNYETLSAYSSPNEVVFHADQTKGPQHPNRWAEIRFVWCHHLFASGVPDCVVRRASIREPLAEFLGTMILIIFGCGGNCQIVLSSNTAVASSPKGVSVQSGLKSTVQSKAMIRTSSPLTLAGLSVRGKMLPYFNVSTCFKGAGIGVWVSGGVSVGHLNPAVRLYSWRSYSIVVDHEAGNTCPGISP